MSAHHIAVADRDNNPCPKLNTALQAAIKKAQAELALCSAGDSVGRLFSVRHAAARLADVGRSVTLSGEAIEQALRNIAAGYSDDHTPEYLNV